MLWGSTLIEAVRDHAPMSWKPDSDLLIPAALERKLLTGPEESLEAELYQLGIITFYEDGCRRFCYHEQSPGAVARCNNVTLHIPMNFCMSFRINMPFCIQYPDIVLVSMHVPRLWISRKTAPNLVRNVGRAGIEAPGSYSSCGPSTTKSSTT